MGDFKSIGGKESWVCKVYIVSEYDKCGRYKGEIMENLVNGRWKVE